ncbi:hypothetical protein BC567DRAFT_233898 [Phyllosticta citribraziliensis]
MSDGRPPRSSHPSLVCHATNLPTCLLGPAPQYHKLLLGRPLISSQISPGRHPQNRR